MPSPSPQTRWRPLHAEEITRLTAQGNHAEDWSRVQVHPKQFDSALIRDCHFFGEVRVGALLPGEALPDEFPLPLGLRRATFIDCEIGDWPAIEDVGRLERVRIGNSAVLWRVGRVQTRLPARFGAGGAIDLDGTPVRAPLAIQNENGRRAVCIWPGMTPGQAALWMHTAGQPQIQARLQRIADEQASLRTGEDSEIGEGAALLDCRTLINVKIGADARLAGADWLEEVMIESSAAARTTIGAGVELRRGMVGPGNTIASGARAHDFLTGENVTLDFGLRLTHSVVGDNSHLARGEVSHALIFPNHQQHHNNSFLIAARLEGQSNLAAGVTLGSNHNSRAPDGEIVAARGFWPGLCANFKHNSRFGPFTLIARGNYPYELNIELPFSLVSNSEDSRELRIAPAWWWWHNLYALARNEWKFAARDARALRRQPIETRTLAPDTVEAMLRGMQILNDALRAAGRTGAESEDAPIALAGAERSHRPVRILRPVAALAKYRELCRYYAARELIDFLADAATFAPRLDHLREIWEFTAQRETAWFNLGGQLVGARDYFATLDAFEAAGHVSAEGLTAIFNAWEDRYAEARLRHACAVLMHVEPAVADASIHRQRASWEVVTQQVIQTARSIAAGVRASRAKDFDDPYRRLTCQTDEEFAAVFGTLGEDRFIPGVEAETVAFEARANAVLDRVRSA